MPGTRLWLIVLWSRKDKTSHYKFPVEGPLVRKILINRRYANTSLLNLVVVEPIAASACLCSPSAQKKSISYAVAVSLTDTFFIQQCFMNLFDMMSLFGELS